MMNLSSLTKYKFLGGAVAGLLGCSQAFAANVISNGNFETGTVAGWSATTTQATSFPASLNDGQNSQVVNGGSSGGPVWYVRNKPSNYFGATASTPISGYSVFNGFDGDPGVFSLKQGFSFSGSAADVQLDFSFAIQSSYGGTERTFDANIMDAAGNTVLLNAFHYVLPYSKTDWVVQAISVDLTAALNALGAGNYTLAFQEFIPQSYSGPAVFGLDNISLDIQVAAVPEPGSLALLGLGLVGLAASRKRKQA